ncbi:MAG: RNA degradosome polyphosphate kinase [Methanobacteriaceae archaeon]|nr:RNA degradosome polyphosphate kinase [Methanobacteriaceae archaeon]
MKEYNFTYTQNRELSWLKFNKRVLDEAKDKTVPLLERLRYISIFTSNLDEFFMIRCGSLYDVTLIDSEDKDNKTGLTAQEQLDKIYKATIPLYEQKDTIYKEVTSELRRYDVIKHQFEELNSVQRKYITQYFYENIAPLLSPQIIDSHHPFPHMINKKIYIYTILNDDNEEKLMGLIPIPASLPRFIKFPKTYEYILIEDLIFAFAETVFNNYYVKYKTITAVTRNADINLQNSSIDEDEDYRHFMKNILNKRKRLAPIRLEFCTYKQHKYNKHLRKKLDLHKNQVFLTHTPINMEYIHDLINSLPKNLINDLTFTPFEPQQSSEIKPKQSLLKQLNKRDILLFYPYETINHFLEFLKESANDPEVLSIKITLYRVARSSSVIKYLLEAIENEKDVTVLIELRARFDEKNNIHYAELLEEAGCQILYGFENYKVHSKICTVTKKHKDKIIQYTQIGTGNYNEKTAKQYTDYCYLTSNQDIGDDATEFFKNMGLSNLNGHYNKLLVAPTSLRDNIIKYIDEEILKAQKDQPTEIIMKMNSLTDRKIIDKLQEASENGVKIKLIIRGICCIIPGLPSKTENIEVRSIVGRYLEHARVYSFGTGENRKIYISSADIMTRNTKKRVEVACPIEDEKLKERILHDLNTMLKDDIKGRRINTDGDYEYIEQARHLNSQEHFQEEAINNLVTFNESQQNKSIIQKIIEYIKELIIK